MALTKAEMAEALFQDMGLNKREARELVEMFFEEGIMGVPRARRFELLEQDGSPVHVLRCLDISGFALPVVDPPSTDSRAPRLRLRVKLQCPRRLRLPIWPKRS